MKFRFILSIVSILFFLASCKSKKVTLVQPDDTTIDSLNDLVFSKIASGDTTNNPFAPSGSKGKVEKALLNWFSDCGAKSATFRKANYVGIASPYYIGTILSTDLQHYKYDLSKMIAADQYNQFVTPGISSESCNISKMKDFSLDFFLGGKFFQTVDAKLGLAIKNAKNITITTGNWTIDNLNEQQFIDYLNNSKDDKLKAYRDYLLNTDNYAVTKVVKIDGFVAKIFTGDTLSPSLTATLQNGFDFNVVPADKSDTTKKIGFTLKFTKSAKDTITVSSTGVIYPLVQISKGQELQTN